MKMACIPFKVNSSECEIPDLSKKRFASSKDFTGKERFGQARRAAQCSRGFFVIAVKGA